MDNKYIDAKIGKDVIESLTLGMYEDSRFVYREYIQNSADQIDLATEIGLFEDKSDGDIKIDIDLATRTVTISDNATGIEADKVQPILKNIAKSTKDRSKNKGFRGIGRLGGIAYCNQLIFETSFKGEDIKSTLSWDAQKLKAIINNRATKEDAQEVINEITEFQQANEESDKHYFKVILKGVNNETLLDKESIYEYLSMVAPVPFDKGFNHKNKIHEKAKELSQPIDEYNIYVNNDQVYKAYTTSIYSGDNNSKNKIGELQDVECYEIRHKNELLAWGWFGISDFNGVLKKINTARYLRLRKGNIQIGLESVFAKFFKEERGTKYYFGEIHAINPQLIPNARRDYFIENQTCSIFNKLLTEQFLDLHRLYQFASDVRSNHKKIEALEKAKEEFSERAEKGFIDIDEKQAYEKKILQKRQLAEQAVKKIAKAKEKIKEETSNSFNTVLEVIVDKTYEDRIENMVQELPPQPIKYVKDTIPKISKKEEKLLSKIFKVINNALPTELAKIVKDKIQEELQK